MYLRVGLDVINNKLRLYDLRIIANLFIDNIMGLPYPIYFEIRVMPLIIKLGLT